MPRRKDASRRLFTARINLCIEKPGREWGARLQVSTASGVTPKRLLVIDDMVDICTLVAGVAERCGYDVKTTADPAEFRDIYRTFRPDVIVLDLAIPGSDGIDLLHFLVEERSAAKILIMSGFPAGVQEAAKRLGEVRGLDMAGTLPKPLRAADLRTILTRLRGGGGGAPL